MEVAALNKADSKRLAAISDMPCIVCTQEGLGDTPAEPHHILQAGRRRGHQYTLPLCFPHHREGLRTAQVVSRHPYLAEFEKRYGTELTLLDIVNRHLNGPT